MSKIKTISILHLLNCSLGLLYFASNVNLQLRLKLTYRVKLCPLPVLFLSEACLKCLIILFWLATLWVLEQSLSVHPLGHEPNSIANLGFCKLANGGCLLMEVSTVLNMYSGTGLEVLMELHDALLCCI